jgi:hypothetical protein
MRIIKSFCIYSLFALLLLMGAGNQVQAQCAMCKATAESNMKEHSNNFGAGLNKGILYLLAMPYLLAGVGVLIWYRHRKQYRS